jgi:hypothetical protein
MAISRDDARRVFDESVKTIVDSNHITATIGQSIGGNKWDKKAASPGYVAITLPDGLEVEAYNDGRVAPVPGREIEVQFVNEQYVVRGTGVVPAQEGDSAATPRGLSVGLHGDNIWDVHFVPFDEASMVDGGAEVEVGTTNIKFKRKMYIDDEGRPRVYPGGDTVPVQDNYGNALAGGQQAWVFAYIAPATGVLSFYEAGGADAPIDSTTDFNAALIDFAANVSAGSKPYLAVRVGRGSIPYKRYKPASRYDFDNKDILRFYTEGFTTLASLADTDITSPADGDAFMYNGSAWENRALDADDVQTGTFPTARIADLAITTAKLADSAVTTAKLDNQAVTTAKIDSNAVTTAKLQTSAVTSTKIAANAVTEAKIANDAVTSDQLADDAVIESRIADGAVTYPKLDVQTLPPAQGRLTLSSTEPLPDSDITAATTLYYLPYAGDQVRLFDGSGNVSGYTLGSSGISVSVPTTTDTNYDVYLYDSSGLTLELVAWTDDTTRATALTREQGVLVKNGDITRLYLGTVRTTDTSGECEDSDTKRLVWNMYQRISRLLFKRDTTTHSYASGSLRPWNNDATNAIEVVSGETVPLTVSGQSTMGNTAGQSVVRPVGTATGDAAVNQITVASVSTAGGVESFGYIKITMNERTDSGTGNFFNFVMQATVNC